MIDARRMATAIGIAASLFFVSASSWAADPIMMVKVDKTEMALLAAGVGGRVISSVGPSREKELEARLADQEAALLEEKAASPAPKWIAAQRQKTLLEEAAGYRAHAADIRTNIQRELRTIKLVRWISNGLLAAGVGLAIIDNSKAHAAVNGSQIKYLAAELPDTDAKVSAPVSSTASGARAH